MTNPIRYRRVASETCALPPFSKCRAGCSMWNLITHMRHTVNTSENTIIARQYTRTMVSRLSDTAWPDANTVTIKDQHTAIISTVISYRMVVSLLRNVESRSRTRLRRSGFCTFSRTLAQVHAHPELLCSAIFVCVCLCLCMFVKKHSVRVAVFLRIMQQ